MQTNPCPSKGTSQPKALVQTSIKNMIVHTHLFGGHLTDDPKLTKTTGGKTVANFSVAYNPPSRTVGGQKVEPNPVFIPCQAWGKLAESIAKRFSKGSAIFAEGELVNSHYEANNGDQVYTNSMRIITAQRPQVTDPNYTHSIISGNLAKDPHAGKIPGTDEDIVTITVMHNPLPYTNDAGVKTDPPVVAVDVCLRGIAARNAATFLKKGSQVLVTGQLYMAMVACKPSGTKRGVLRISATNVKFLRSDRADASAPTAAPAAQDRAPVAAPAGAAKETLDEDVPF